MAHQYVVCSNCDFSTQGNTVTVQCCPYCGSETLDECPHCHHMLSFKGQRFCPQCKKPLKPEATETHTSDNT